MIIRNAQYADLPAVAEIYADARRFMAANGNPTQWPDGYPYRDMLEEDIALGQLYVLEENQELQGVFMFAVGNDPTYTYIEGKWPSDTPYGVVHRVASAGKTKGLLARIIAWAAAQCPVLRMDTHRDNKPMQHLLEKLGFVRCGIIYVEDGTPRIAYQKG